MIEQQDNMDPTKDPEVTETYGGDINRLMDKIMPYQRYIMIVGFTILVMLVVFLGYARGALDVCNDLGGRLEVNIFNIKCHPGSYNLQSTTGNNIAENLYMIPNFTYEEVK